MQHAFLKIENVKGECLDQSHLDWIEIERFSQDLLQPRSATASSSGGQTAARVNLSPIEIQKKIDLATTTLAQACTNGSTFAKAEIEFMRADGNSSDLNSADGIVYYRIELLNVLVHRITTTVDDEGMPLETVQLSFGAIKWTYTKQDPGGGVNGNSIAQWSASKNRPTFQV